MDKFNIRKEITALINNIKEDSERLENRAEASELEQNQMFDKIELLNKKIIVFNYLNTLSALPDTAPLPNILDSQENITETVSLPESEIIETPVQEVVLEEPESNTDQTEVLPLVEPATIVVELKEEIVLPVVEITETVIETKPKEVKPQVNNIQKPPLADIKSAIGINDKFQFINELFGGNADEFNAAINSLNSSGTVENAMLSLSGLQQKYNWKEDSEAAKRLSELVERRYL